MPDVPNAPLYVKRDETTGDLVVDDRIHYVDDPATEHRPPQNDPGEDPEYERAKRARFR
jgi:hypothetical protein